MVTLHYNNIENHILTHLAHKITHINNKNKKIPSNKMPKIVSSTSKQNVMEK